MDFSFSSRSQASKRNATASRLVPARHVVSTSHGTRTVLLDARNGHYWGLDEVGSRIWTLVQSGLTPDQIAIQLSEEYDAPLPRLQSDVESFMQRLRAAKLMEAQ